MKNYLYITLLLLVASCTTTIDASKTEKSEPIKVEIRREGESYKMYRGGKPYTFNGAGLSGDIESLQKHGGNSFRTWSVGTRNETGKEVLDKALENGMTVNMCFYVQSERHGMNYDSIEQVNKQFERIKKQVLEHKDHPALLTWTIGNELNLSYSNPKVYDEVNRISKWIHEVDPNHPTTTTIASVIPSVVKDIKERATDLDFLSVQVYGDLFVLQKMLKEADWTGPYMVTEWGAIGHWEMGFTEWGAPIEQSSSEKAATYLRGYQESIEPYSNQCLGNYVFLWGQKQERTPTWYGLFLESGEETEPIDVMHYIWNEEWPENRTPRLDSMTLDGKKSRENIYLKPGKSCVASVFAMDFEKDSLLYKWVVMRESKETKEGGDEEQVPESLKMIESATESSVRLLVPDVEGAYRLFAYVYDGNGHAAHANIPFYVKN